MTKDFYSVLDIPAGTDKEEIRQAYMHLARKYYPDVDKDPKLKAQFEEINMAYTILYDDESRIFYNLYREGEIEYSAQENQAEDELNLPVIILFIVWISLIGSLIWVLTN
jgi:DnaJ-class molecular chaperone